MYDILDEHYGKIMGKGIEFGNLGHSTKEFNFFLTSSISQSITSSKASELKSSSLLNKLISLSSKSDYTLIDKVISKLSQKYGLNKSSEDKMITINNSSSASK
jgi:hypothetical protein